MKVRELLPVIKDHFCICRYVGRNENGDLIDETLATDYSDPKDVAALLDREIIAVKGEYEASGIVIVLADKEGRE